MFVRVFKFKDRDLFVLRESLFNSLFQGVKPYTDIYIFFNSI